MARSNFARLCVFAVAVTLLAGCTDADWRDLNPLGDTTNAPAPTPSPPPQAVLPASDDSLENFCRGYANSEAWNAARIGTGSAEQARISERTYKNCMTLGYNRSVAHRVFAGVVVRIEIFQAQGADRIHLRDVLAGFCPVEVRLTARQDDEASWRERHQLALVELFPSPM